MVDFKKILANQALQKVVADTVHAQLRRAPVIQNLLPRAEPSDGEDPVPGSWDAQIEEPMPATLQELPRSARWVELLADAAEYHDVQDLLGEPDLWSVNGLAFNRFLPSAAGFSLVRILDRALFEGWLRAHRPHLLDEWHAALALAALRGAS